MKILAWFCAAGVFASSSFAQPSIFADGVLNGASFAKGQAVAPGGAVAVFGTGLAAATIPGSTIPLSTNIGGTTVTVNGFPAGLYFVSDGQVNVQLPWELQPGAASAPFQFQVTAAAPGVFSIPPGVGYGIAINPDGSLAAPAGAIPGVPTHPANVGDTLIVLATGLGAVSPAVADSAASLDALRFTLITPVVTIGGKQAQVSFSGLAPQFPGINQLNVVVPPGVSGPSLPLQIQMNGITSTDQVVIAVQ